MKRIKMFFQEESGVTAMEYGMILGLLAAAVIAGISLFYENLAVIFSNWATFFANRAQDVPS
jgi:pilus assembly protein Flp/PilA